METVGHVLKLAKEYMAKYKQLKRVDIKVDDSGVWWWCYGQIERSY